MERPKIGIGIIIQNSKKEILIGRRKGSHSPFFSIPGGHLENGESFEEAAIREVFEETGLKINNPRVISTTNNLQTFLNEGKHYVSINLFTDDFEGQPTLKEPDKCEGWKWYNISELPQPHFDASAFAIECLVKNQFYIKDQYEMYQITD